MEERLREASEKVAFMRFGSVVIQSGDEDAKKLGQQADLLTRERLCKGLSMFDAVLERIKVGGGEISTMASDAVV